MTRLAERYAGRLKVGKVNVDDNPASARTYDASSIPRLVMLRDGKVVGQVVGARPGAGTRRTGRAAAADFGPALTSPSAVRLTRCSVAECRLCP
jgi:hypothetical protein